MPITRALRIATAWLALGFSLGLSGIAHAGDTLNLERYRGNVVLVDFWASWCTSCRQSFPWLNDMQAKYAKRGLIVVGVNVDKAPEDAARFLREVPARFDVVYDPDGALATHYDVPGMPSSYVFDANGKLIAKHIGFRSGERAEREAELERLLPKTTP